jgi:hypothetical protein
LSEDQVTQVGEVAPIDCQKDVRVVLRDVDIQLLRLAVFKLFESRAHQMVKLGPQGFIPDRSQIGG